jgi:CelD/BcsL family acetyltransferase involved in cellulose biosynthesis
VWYRERTMEVTQVPIDDSSWTEFVSAHPAATAFHLPAWASLIADCYGYEAFALSVRDDSSELIAGLPVIAVRSPLGARRWVSLPFTDHCPMLVRDGAPLDAVVGALREYVLAGNAAELEVRGALAAGSDVYPTHHGYRHVLRLPDDAGGLRPGKGHRYSCNRARRLGVEVTCGGSLEDVRTFYGLHVLTRRRLGVPVQPRRFFDLIADRLIAEGHGFVATAACEGNPVSSGLYLGYNGTLIAKYGASNPPFRDLGGDHLLDQEVLDKACREGYRFVDWGRTDLGADGLRRYKLGWGSAEELLAYTHVSSRPPVPDSVRSGRASRAIISHSPAWVCRALGELLYRWVA